MHTSVRTTILDDSISGDKIHGGTISGLDGLYTDGLWIPDDGTAAAAINGSGVKVGLVAPIEVLFAESIGAVGNATSNALYNDAWIPVAYFASNAGNGYMQVRNNSGSVRTSISSYSLNYFLDKLIIGQATATQSASMTMEIHGTSYAEDLRADAIRISQVLWLDGALSFMTTDGITTLNSFYESWKLRRIRVDDMSTGLEISNGLTDLIAAQLGNIGTNVIEAADWAIVSALNTGPTLSNGAILSVGDLFVKHYHRNSANGALSFDSQAIGAITVRWDVFRTSVVIRIQEGEFNPGGVSTYDGFFEIDLSHTDFASLWNDMGNDQFIVGPHVISEISSTGAWYQTLIFVDVTLKKMYLKMFDATGAYTSFGEDFPTIDGNVGDKIKFRSFTLTLRGDT